jgi:hypothetical protein
MADHLERRRPRPDDDPGLQHHRLDTRVDQDLADLGARAQVARQIRALGMQAAQVDDSAHACLFCGVDDVFGRLLFLGDEVLRRSHRMHEVVDDVDAVERLDQRVRSGQVAARHVHVIAPRRVGQLVGVTRKRAHPHARLQ